MMRKQLTKNFTCSLYVGVDFR